MIFNFENAGCGGLIYDGVNIADVFQIVDVSFPLLPSITAATHDLAQRSGSYFASRQVGTRNINLKLRLNAESRDPMDIFKAWREVSEIFNKTEPKKLYLNEDKYCYALFVGESTIENIAYYGDVEFQFVCYDPFFYGEEYEKSITNNSLLTFTVKGDIEAYPEFELTATTTSVKISNEDTGEYVNIPNTKSGAKIYVNMEQQRSIINGVYAPVDLASDYFNISNTAKIKVTGASGTLRYKERFV